MPDTSKLTNYLELYFNKLQRVYQNSLGTFVITFEDLCG